MPKAYFFNVPGHGHVNPSLPLVAELTKRGHHIIYYLTDSYRAKVEATGAEFRAYSPLVRDDYFTSRGLDGSRPMRAAHALMHTTAEILPELIETAREEKPDYILFDGMCPWGQLLPRILGIPGVASLALMPIGSARQMLNWEIASTLLPRLLMDFGVGYEAKKIADALGKQYNIPSIGITGIMNGLGDLSFSYTSKYYQPYADGVSPSVRFVGRVENDPPQDESFPLHLAGDRRIVYISLGSLINDNMAFFKACIEAFTGAGEYVIMSTGRGISPQAFGTLPENIAIYDWVPQIDILKRASLFITHGGLGSISDGLYFGLPLLLVPQQDEQTMNGMRVIELGAGLMLKKNQVTAQTIREKARRLLDDPSFQRESARIGDTMREAGGVARAADEIEALLAKRA